MSDEREPGGPDPSDAAFRRDLGDGLVLRWSTAADADGITRLYGQAFRDGPDDPPSESLVAWARAMLAGGHPLIDPGDFAVVEETARGTIIAATCLLRQSWEVGGIVVPIGRPEVVASDPDYRRRGLVRAVFELIHARSQARGDLLQAITGIPYFYRQFGYEYALDMGGSRSVSFGSIPRLKEGQPEPYTLRRATPEDLDLVQRLYERERAHATISTRIEAAYWRHALAAAPPPWHAHLILDAAGEPAGYLLTGPRRWGPSVVVHGLAMLEGRSLVAALPSLLRALEVHAATLPPPRKPDAPPISGISFVLGRDHPAYGALDEGLNVAAAPPYAWYVRVPDLPAFIRHLTPLLEARLAGSAAAGHDGELRLDFYRGGLRLVFAGGRLAEAADWRAPVWGTQPQAGFPPLVFLQLLFGHRSLDELRHAFPDVWAEDEAGPLLKALFPPQPAWVMPLG